MTTYYVGPGGNDGNPGTSWATRKLTLNGAEDIPVAPGDDVIVGPGLYPELLTCDVNGTPGNYITYTGDYTGASTDGVGGQIILSGSDDFQTSVRGGGVTTNAKSYRKFVGLHASMGSSYGFYYGSGSTEIHFDKCIASYSGYAGFRCDYPNAGNLFRFTNCWSMHNLEANFYFQSNLAPVIDAVYESCVSLGCRNYGFRNVAGGMSGITIKNSTVVGSTNGINGQYAYVTALNNIVVGCQIGMVGWNSTAYVTSDYNALYNGINYSNVTPGANDVLYPTFFDARPIYEMLYGGNLVSLFDLDSRSALVDLACSSPPATDFRGTSAIGGVRERGALEYDPFLKIAGGGGAVNIG